MDDTWFHTGLVSCLGNITPWFHTELVSCLGNITIWKNEWEGENGRRQFRKSLMKAMQESDGRGFTVVGVGDDFDDRNFRNMN